MVQKISAWIGSRILYKEDRSPNNTWVAQVPVTRGTNISKPPIPYTVCKHTLQVDSYDMAAFPTHQDRFNYSKRVADWNATVERWDPDDFTDADLQLLVGAEYEVLSAIWASFSESAVAAKGERLRTRTASIPNYVVGGPPLERPESFLLFMEQVSMMDD